LVACGRHAEHREYCAKLLEQHGQTKNPNVALGLIGALIYGPNAVDDWSLPLKLSQLVLSSDGGRHYKKTRVSSLLCRAGEYERSLELRAETITEAGREPHGLACLWQAMAHQGLGNLDQARVLASKARELADSGQLGGSYSQEFLFDSMYQELMGKLDESPLPLAGEVGLSGPGEGTSSKKVKPNDTIR
jgi:hypothetical protein